MKFYSIKFRLVTLLLLLGLSSTSFAQVWTSAVEDIFLDSVTQSESVLKYTYTLYNDKPYSFNQVFIIDRIATGTTYVDGTTEVNGVSWPDVNGLNPLVASYQQEIYLPLPNGAGVLLPGETATVTYLVSVDANAGVINHGQYSVFSVDYSVGGGFSTGFEYTAIPITDDISCAASYLSNAGTADANTLPTNAAPNSFISMMNLADGNRLTTVFNGNSIYNYYANTNTRLPVGTTLLKDASAIALDNTTQRIYFVNNSTTDQQELYYVSLVNSPVRAYKFSNTTPYYLNTNTGAGYNITRMTFTPFGVGYALTDNGQELIRFSVTGNVPTITNLGPLVNGSQNVNNLVENETGGDLCADYNGQLHLVTNSGKMYDIYPNVSSGPRANYMGTPAGLPATGNNSVAIGYDGKMVVSGAYQNAYKIDYQNMTATSITGGSTTNVFTSGDYASCYTPQNPRKEVTKPAIQEATANVTVRVNPNPFINNLTVQVTLPATEKVHIRLMDLYGRTVFTKTENLSGGINTLNLNVPGKLASGMYMLDVWAGNKRLIQKKLSHL